MNRNDKFFFNNLQQQQNMHDNEEINTIEMYAYNKLNSFTQFSMTFLSFYLHITAQDFKEIKQLIKLISMFSCNRRN